PASHIQFHTIFGTCTVVQLFFQRRNLNIMTNVYLLPASFVTSLRPTRSSVHKSQHKQNFTGWHNKGDVITTMAYQRNNSLRLISTRKINPETPKKITTSLLNHQQSRTITAERYVVTTSPDRSSPVEQAQVTSSRGADVVASYDG
ncbi:unnamed protein product, partial [Ectocarpus sp. 12 AP-2014]